MMALALTGKVNPYKVGFGPFSADVFHATFPDAYRGVSIEQSLASIERIFRADVEASRVAAIIIEPVQGEGGFNVAPFEFMRALRSLCDRHGILLIADEIQTGFGRTGKMFAVEHSGVAPDLIADRESDRRRIPDLGGDRPRRRDGRADSWWPRQHLRGQCGFMRGGTRGARRDGRRGHHRARE